MATNRNCSDNVDGFNFQTVACISLLIDNLDSFEYIRNEGIEDIVIKLLNGQSIYAQSKKSINFIDNPNYSTVLNDALKTLTEDDQKNDCIQLIYVTNVEHMLGAQTDIGIFNTGISVQYGNLGFKNRQLLDNYLNTYPISKEKFSIHYIAYNGDGDQKIEPTIKKLNNYLENSDSLSRLSGRKIFDAWYLYLNKNQGEHEITKVCYRSDIAWGMIIYLIDYVNTTLFREFQDTYPRLQSQYGDVVKTLKGQVPVLSRILAEFFIWSKSQPRDLRTSKLFAEVNWENYRDIITDYSVNEEYIEPVLKCLIRQIIEQDTTICDTLKEMNIDEDS